MNLEIPLDYIWHGHRCMDRELFLGYADPAPIAALRYVQGATEEQLARMSQSPLAGRPLWPGQETLVINASDYTEHTGQIAYFRAC